MSEPEPIQPIPGAPIVTLSTSLIINFQTESGNTRQFTVANESENTVLNFNFEVEGEIPESGLNLRIVNVEAPIPDYSYLSQLDISQAVTTTNNQPVFDETNDSFSLTITEPKTTLSIPILADGINEEAQRLDFALTDVEDRNYNVSDRSFGNIAIFIDDFEDLPDSLIPPQQNMNAQSFLMIPDSVSDRIVLFDANDGSLVDDNFIDGSSETGLGIFQTPLNAVQVNNEIWVSDQVADAIFSFDLQGNYLGVVGDNDGDGDTDGLDNIRGMEFINGSIYVANAGDDNDAPGDGEVVVVFDPAGNNLGFFDTGDPTDIRAYNNELLITDINRDSDGGEDIDRYSIDGINSTLLGTFVESDGETGIDFPQQITLRESNGNVLVSGFSNPGGIYEYDVNGNQIDFLNAEDGFANIVRAAYELNNGKIIWSGGDGVVVTDSNTGENTDIYTVNNLDFRPGARYIEPLIVPQAGKFDPEGAVFFGDQRLEKLYITKDLSGDGDANDPLEVNVYFDETNADGLANPTQNIFTILSAKDGSVFYGDGDTDSVYRLQDSNHDGDALDAGEASVWFSAANAENLPLLTPNGLSQGSDRAIYVVEADTVGTPNGDFVYRTEDLNQDGDALDAGEANVWLDLTALNPSSSPFEITFIEDTAYISDTAGGSPVIYRAEDTDNSGNIDETEVSVLVEGIFAFGLSSNSESLFALDLINDSVVKIEDGDTTTVTEVWNRDAVPEGYALGAAFSIAAGENDELAIASNGADANEDNLFSLVDLNSDGDYFDKGETIPYVSRLLTSNVPERPRVVEFARTPEVEDPEIRGDAGDNEIIGTDGDDTIFGLGGDDFIDGGDGNDDIKGNSGSDTLIGGAGDDNLATSTGSDLVFGGEGNDRIIGREDNDLLSGDAGDDTIRAGGGDDTLIGVTGRDVLSGQEGSDIFVFGNGDGRDVITDFEPGEDKIGLVIGELTFEDITLKPRGNNVLLQVTETRENLALVRNTSIEDFSADTFVQIDDVSQPGDETVEVAAEASYFTFGGDVSDSSNRRLLADKAPVIGFEGLETISFLQFDLSDISAGKIEEVNLTLEYDSELAETLIPATADRPVSVSAYEVTAPFDPINGNADDIDYGEAGANAISTTLIGDDGVYSWDVTDFIREELLGSSTEVNLALSGVFGNENIDDRNSYASFYPVGATEGLVPTLVIET